MTAGRIASIGAQAPTTLGFARDPRLAAALADVSPTRLRALDSTLVAFETDLAEGTDEHYRGRWLLGMSGALAGQKLPVIGYENTNGTLRVLNHTTDAPASGDKFRLLP